MGRDCASGFLLFLFVFCLSFVLLSAQSFTPPCSTTLSLNPPHLNFGSRKLQYKYYDSLEKKSMIKERKRNRCTLFLSLRCLFGFRISCPPACYSIILRLISLYPCVHGRISPVNFKVLPQDFFSYSNISQKGI